ncbi:MAG: type II secretion system protein [Planctomycetes bacterium]|nr:type II secretion system protein [Planctomycetota bacterium]MBI3847960.1 type II secretion system protein [Planctomycetota bacterium]
MNTPTSPPRAGSRSDAGFTLIELVVIILILGVLSAVAVPIFVDLRTQANAAAEEGVVGNVRSAIGLYYANQAASGTPRYPGSLDAGANNSTASNTNQFFTTVLAQGGVQRDWRKNGTGQYVGPAAGVYVYTSASGQFAKQ